MSDSDASFNDADATAQDIADSLRKMNKVVNNLMARADCIPFREPVDWKGLQLYDYPKIITKMMDLGTIKSKLEKSKYSDASQVANDIRLVWKNCMTYNADGSDFYRLAESYSKRFEERYVKLLDEFGEDVVCAYSSKTGSGRGSGGHGSGTRGNNNKGNNNNNNNKGTKKSRSNSFVSSSGRTTPVPNSEKGGATSVSSASKAENNNNYNYNNNGENAPVASSFAISGLFVTRKPRDIIEGLRSALSNAIRGTFYGLAALIASPIGGLKFGAGGVAAGLVAGAILGVSMPLVGFAIGGYQMLRGLVETPAAIMDGFVGCKIYDEGSGTWEEYRLDDDAGDIKRALREEEEGRNKTKNDDDDRSGARDNGNGNGSRRRVENSEYYDLLGVRTDAAPSDVRSAYRKRARSVHPDKNPDDPNAEKKFRELSAAYQTLSDPAKRKRYDSSGVGVDPERPDGGEDGAGAMVDPIVFFAVLFGSEAAEPYIGELGMATTFDALLKLGSATGASFDNWEDVKTAFGWSEAALKRRKRETDIAVHLRERVSDYVDGYLALEAFRDTCWEEAVGIAKGGSYGASFLLAIGPALVAEADAFLGYRSSILGSWRGPVSNAKRNLLFLRRKWGVTKSVLRTAKESLKALYQSAEIIPSNDDDDEAARRRRRLNKNDNKQGNNNKRKAGERLVFNDQQLLKDNLSNTIPTVLEMAWAINYVDISTTLYGACGKLFHDADVSSWQERLRRAEAVHILGSQFYLVGLEVTGGNATLGGDVDDIKARANAAFMESLKKGMQDDTDKRSSGDEM